MTAVVPPAELQVTRGSVEKGQVKHDDMQTWMIRHRGVQVQEHHFSFNEGIFQKPEDSQKYVCPGSSSLILRLIFLPVAPHDL